jgi:hypothetical protein
VTVRGLSIWRVSACFGALGLIPPGIIVVQAFVVGHEFWKYQGVSRTIHYLALRFWPTWILILGATKEPAFSPTAMVAFGVAVVANVVLYAIVGCVVVVILTSLRVMGR